MKSNQTQPLGQGGKPYSDYKSVDVLLTTTGDTDIYTTDWERAQVRMHYTNTDASTRLVSIYRIPVGYPSDVSYQILKTVELLAGEHAWEPSTLYLNPGYKIVAKADAANVVVVHAEVDYQV